VKVPVASEESKRAAQESGLQVRWHAVDGELVPFVPLASHAVVVEEAEKWKRIAQDRCTCVRTCGDTPEDSGGVCKELPRGGNQ
jgi:hypothetical protein